MERFKLIQKGKIDKLPKTPGVYAFKTKKAILYIGKATNLKERIKNHFSQPTHKDNYLIRQTDEIGFIKTGSEIEALILEANLIKKYRPKYNVVWKDDKNYFFIALTKEKFPKVFITHQKNKSGVDYIGPFVDGNSLRQVLKILRKVFPYRTCNPPSGGLPKKPCLWYQLNRCPAPCILKNPLAKQIPTSEVKMKKDYALNIKNLAKVLKGEKSAVVNGFKKEMRQASKNQDFEKASKTRDKIWALEKVFSHSKVLEETKEKTDSDSLWQSIEKELQQIIRSKKPISRIEAYDISNIQGKNPTGSMVSFFDGKPDKKYYRKFKIKTLNEPNDIGMLKEVLSRRLRHPEWSYPELLLIDGGKAQLNIAIKTKNLNPKSKKIKVMAIAKKNNELFIEGRAEPLLLKNLPREIYNLILQLRDEAHRFAKNYHLKLRKNELIKKTP